MQKQMFVENIYSSCSLRKVYIFICMLFMNFMPVVAKSDYIKIGDFKYCYDTDTREASVCENGYGKYSGDVIIPSNISIDGIDCQVVELKPMLFFLCTDLTSIQLPKSLKKIGSSCFNTCRELEEIEIPESVTEIGGKCFQDCSSLKSLKISSTNFSVVGDGLFMGCTSLKKVELPVSVMAIGKEAFKNCSKLSSFALPSSVKELGDDCFAGCESLAYMDIPAGISKLPNNCFYACI